MTYRIVTWTEKRGINGVSQYIDDKAEAMAEANLMREANPSWLRIDLEAVSDDGSSKRLLTL